MFNIWYLIAIIGCSWKFQPLDSQIICPLECICLSQTQVLCNTGGLEQIPLRLLPSSVENLALTKNNFPVIKSDSFAGLRALKKLSLDGNNITKIKQFAFRGLPRLKELSIQHTPLQIVSNFAFAGLQNLSTILLSHNQIVRIESNAFAGTSNIKLILLSNNPMIKIETAAFSGLTNVGHLLLPSGIRTIEPDAFFGMEGVGLLKLAYMDLRELSSFTFRGLSNVKILTLQESDLGIICSDAFNGLVHVESLQILNNKIDAIEELNFTYPQQIQHLKLQGNHLLEMPEPNTLILDGIDELIVINNHFPCGCHIHTLLDSPLANGTYQNYEFLSKNYCISPLEVNGKPMSSLDIDAIGRCQEQVTKGNLESSATTLNNYKIINKIIVIVILFRYIWEIFLIIILKNVKRFNFCHRQLTKQFNKKNNYHHLSQYEKILSSSTESSELNDPDDKNDNVDIDDEDDDYDYDDDCDDDNDKERNNENENENGKHQYYLNGKSIYFKYCRLFSLNFLMFLFHFSLLNLRR